jgi:hypothetical protein
MKLSEHEIEKTIKKIKDKYNTLIKDFNKPRSILKSFEDRFIDVLKKNQDVSKFLIGEIEAIEEFHNKEIQKKEESKKIKADFEKRKGEKSFVDRIFEENVMKIQKYPSAFINEKADEDIQKLIGAIREFITKYFPALPIIFDSQIYHSIKNYLSAFHHKIILKYNYRDEVPIARTYISALEKIPIDTKKVEYEYYFILKESAFILNDFYDYMKNLFRSNKIPDTDQIINISSSELDNELAKNFKGLTVKQSFDKIFNYLENMIIDFRIKDIKKK